MTEQLGDIMTCYMTMEITVHNADGYQYVVRTMADGVYEIVYSEDGGKNESRISFNKYDVDQLLDAIKTVVDFDNGGGMM